MISEAQLLLEAYEVSAEIGIHEHEIGRRQRVLVDVEMSIDPKLDFASDKLENTLDYDFLREDITQLVSHRRFNTQEGLCQAILAVVLGKPHVVSAIVTTRKPDAYPDARGVGCRMCGVN